MSKINDGGPAFPSVLPAVGGKVFPGMTLRDYFAAKAMQVELDGVDLRYTTLAEVSSKAYRMADAMIRAREANNG